jgi:anti-anti-sigma factor
LARKLNLISIDRDGVVRVASAGDLTAADVRPGGRNPFHALLGANWPSHWVLLDLSATHFMDSAVIGWLLTSQRTLRDSGGGLAVHSVAPRVGQMFDLLRLDRAMPVFETEAAAVEYVNDVEHIRAIGAAGAGAIPAAATGGRSGGKH